MVIYYCCGLLCDEDCEVTYEIEHGDPYLDVRKRYEPIRGARKVIRHGYTSAAFGGCSECLGGVGAPM